MQTDFPSILVSPPDALPFDKSIALRAFVLKREAGVLLIHNATQLDANALSEIGVEQIERQYLNHRHEVQLAEPPLDVPLYCHEAEAEAVRDVREVAGTFDGRTMLGDDFEIIPIPGHVPGATAYLWNDGETRFLFTGDSICLSEGEWVAAVLGSSDRNAYLASLARLREVEFDVLMPWAATKDQPFYMRTDKADTRRRLNEIIDRLRDGENH